MKWTIETTFWGGDVLACSTEHACCKWPMSAVSRFAWYVSGVATAWAYAAKYSLTDEGEKIRHMLLANGGAIE